MKIDEIYEEIRSILRDHQISEEESAEMIDYLEENAAESGLNPEEYVESLGSPDQIAEDFMAESKRLREYRSDNLPPLPGRRFREDEPEAANKPHPNPGPHPAPHEHPEVAPCLHPKPEPEKRPEDEPEQPKYGPLSEDRIPANYLKEEAEFERASNRIMEEAGHRSHANHRAEEPRDHEAGSRSYSMDKEEGGEWYPIPAERFDRVRALKVSLTNGFCEIHTGEKSGIRIHEGERFVSVEIRKDKIQIEQNPGVFLPFINDRKGIVEIIVPDDAVFEKIEIDSVNMSFEGSGLQAEKIRLETVNGSLRIRDSRAEKITVDSVNGAIEVASCSFEKLKAENVRGEIRLEVDPNMKITAETVSGKIRAEEPFVQSLTREVVGSRLRYIPSFSRHERGKVNASNVSGGVFITCRPNR